MANKDRVAETTLFTEDDWEYYQLKYPKGNSDCYSKETMNKCEALLALRKKMDDEVESDRDNQSQLSYYKRLLENGDSSAARMISMYEEGRLYSFQRQREIDNEIKTFINVNGVDDLKQALAKLEKKYEEFESNCRHRIQPAIDDLKNMYDGFLYRRSCNEAKRSRYEIISTCLNILVIVCVIGAILLSSVGIYAQLIAGAVAVVSLIISFVLSKKVNKLYNDDEHRLEAYNSKSIKLDDRISQTIKMYYFPEKANLINKFRKALDMPLMECKLPKTHLPGFPISISRTRSIGKILGGLYLIISGAIMCVQGASFDILAMIICGAPIALIGLILLMDGVRNRSQEASSPQKTQSKPKQSKKTSYNSYDPPRRSIGKMIGGGFLIFYGAVWSAIGAEGHPVMIALGVIALLIGLILFISGAIKKPRS